MLIKYVDQNRLMPFVRFDADEQRDHLPCTVHDE